MNGRQAWLSVIVVSCCLALTSVVWAMSLTNYAMNWDVISGGGRPVASTNYSLDGTLGQAIAGDSQSANYGVNGGYWQGLLSSVGGSRVVYISLILKSYAPFCNGDFEQGTSCWSFGGMERHTVSTAMPHGGSQSALLGGDKSVYNCEGGLPIDDSAWMEQTFNVPDEGSPELSFWYRLYSYHQPEHGMRVDSFEVKVGGATVFEDILNWATVRGCDLPAPNDRGWRQETLDLSVYRGKTIALRFEVWNRGHEWYNTWAYIDDISLQ